MASGKFSQTFTSYDYAVIVEWSSEATTSTNSSVITADIYLDVIYTLRTSQHDGSKITINGVEYPFTSPTINADGETVHLATITSNAITHDSDGNKSVKIVCDYAVNATISGTYYGTITASDTVDLDLIPRKATLTSAENFNDEGNPTITYSNPAGNAVSGLYAAIYSSDGSTAYAAYRSITKTATSYTFSLTTAERNALRNAIPEDKSMSVRFYLKTTISGTSYYSYITKTLTITNANPTISPTIADTNSTTLALTGSADTIVRYFSNAAITIGAAAVKGATLKSQKASCGGKSFTTASGTLNAVESGTFGFTATDSRGNTTSIKVEKTFVDYVKLTANFKPSITVDGVITFTVSGNYFNGSFGSVSNSLDAYYRYKAEDGDYGDWVELSTSVYTSTYDSQVSFTIPDFDYKKTYTFQIKANDKLMALAEKEYVITALPVFDWSKEDFNFNVPVNGINLDGLVNAISTRTTLTPTVVPGENYTSASGSVYLYGSNMRVYFTATRSSAATAGNIANETICSFSIPHGGKIKNTATVYFPIANNGSVAYLGNAEIDDELLTFNITLSYVGVAGSTMTSYFEAPITIDVNAYV